MVVGENSELSLGGEAAALVGLTSGEEDREDDEDDGEVEEDADSRLRTLVCCE